MTTTLTIPRSVARKQPVQAVKIPPLENGDRLSVDEFLRRYAATPELKKAELIFGRVYVSPPVSIYGHAYPHGILMTVLGVYMAETPGVILYDNGTSRIAETSAPQPDAAMFIDPRFGGRATFDDDDYILSGIDLVAEVALTSANYDLHDKQDLYEKAGIHEYLVWRTFDRELDYFILTDGKYVRHVADGAGVFQSSVYPGLRIDSKALLVGNLSEVLKTLQAGIASEAHTQFVSSLQSKIQPKA